MRCYGPSMATRSHVFNGTFVGWLVGWSLFGESYDTKNIQTAGFNFRA